MYVRAYRPWWQPGGIFFLHCVLARTGIRLDISTDATIKYFSSKKLANAFHSFKVTALILLILPIFTHRSFSYYHSFDRNFILFHFCSNLCFFCCFFSLFAQVCGICCCSRWVLSTYWRPSLCQIT